MRSRWHSGSESRRGCLAGMDFEGAGDFATFDALATYLMRYAEFDWRDLIQ